MRWFSRFSLLLPLLLLAAGCTDLRPFAGNPGGNAPRLIVPPAYRIAVPVPDGAGLPPEAAARYAALLAEALVAAEVPASATEGNPLDWTLQVAADRQGAQVVPRYALRDADGSSLGQAAGRPVPARDWDGAAPPLLKEVAARDAPAIATLLGQVEASRKASDPAALAGKGPLKVRLAGVRGAPGDGNTSLNSRLAEFLTKFGLVPQNTADGATYAVQGVVNAVNVADNKQRIELQWIVSRRDGYELGRVVQLNEVPRGTLNGLWGDVAYVAAEQAASGIRQVLDNATQAPPEAPEGAPPAGSVPPEPARPAAR
ncbi:hypothetical protein [Teichococcus vastitatis]|uniref:Lipoprotein n=1 Tax=Teichococcus vastitatis TaxID=2307076 RepID=A0ABS9W4F8_9PROT|nr:hypothetical protein [Pseudoroseomonas vastitatis]MCI0754169.1 hypothetical protein [Pseudoroseomonas vastitatis]